MDWSWQQTFKAKPFFDLQLHPNIKQGMERNMHVYYMCWTFIAFQQAISQTELNNCALGFIIALGINKCYWLVHHMLQNVCLSVGLHSRWWRLWIAWFLIQEAMPVFDLLRGHLIIWTMFEKKLACPSFLMIISYTTQCYICLQDYSKLASINSWIHLLLYR